MPICQYVELEENPGHYACKVCGVHSPEDLMFKVPPFRQCPADPIGAGNRIRLGLPPFNRDGPSNVPEPPEDFIEALEELEIEFTEEDGHLSLQQLYLRWQSAIKKWQEAGKPIRSKEEMHKLLEICKACDKYDTRMGLGYCKVCGCHVNTSTIGELNKIRMGTEFCPLDKWPK